MTTTHIAFALWREIFDSQRYTLHLEGYIPHLSRVTFRPHWFIAGREKRENSWCVSPSRFTLTRISSKRVGVERQGKTVRVHRAHDREQMRCASNFSFYATGYVLGRRSISHVARDDKTLRAKWPVHLGPAKPAIHSAEPSHAARHTREKDAKLEH